MNSPIFIFMIEFTFCGCEPYFRPTTRRENFGYVCCTWRKNNPSCNINAWSGKRSNLAFSKEKKCDHCSFVQQSSLNCYNAQIIYSSKQFIFWRFTYQCVLLHIRVTEMGNRQSLSSTHHQLGNLICYKLIVEICFISLFKILLNYF